MGRLIQDKGKQPLAEELLFGKLANGGEVHVTLKDDKLAFELTPAAPRPAKERKRSPAGRKPGAAPASEGMGEEE